MKEIELTQGKFTKVDDDVYEKINAVKWSYDHGYARGRFLGKNVYLHRFLTNPPINMEIDHIDHDKLNNQMCNLRICSGLENNRNRTPIGKSKYLGVHYQGKFIRSRIAINGKNKHLGYFKTEEDAAIAFDKAQKELRGEFANLNFK